jgi:YD repeat-containing protein
MSHERALAAQEPAMTPTAKLVLSVLIGLFLIGGVVAPATGKFMCANPRPCCCCTAENPDRDCGEGACRNIDASGEDVSITGEDSTFVEPIVSATGANGVGLDLSLVYQTAVADGEVGTVATGLGYGWSHSYNVLIFQQSRDLFRLDANGIITRYRSAGRRSGGTYVPTRGNRESVTYNGNSIDIEMFVGGAVWHFEKIPGNPVRVGASEPWMLKHITDRNGNETVLTYENGRLAAVTGPYGRNIGFDYNAGRLQTITDPSGDQTRLSYDGAGNLKQIQRPENRQLSFRYNPRHQ